MDDINTIAILGAGAMGTGIAQIAASAGHIVILYDEKHAALEHSKNSLSKTLLMLTEKGKISTTDANKMLARCRWTNVIKDVAAANMVIEAIVEDKEAKKYLFHHVESFVTESCILTSNTSSLSISGLAAGLKHPERFAGLHFFNPAPVMKLTEVIPALQSQPRVITRLVNLMTTWGKHPVVAKDTPGFIVNRVARCFYSEALRICDEQLAGPSTIDRAMKNIGGFKMGPFELMDFIGHDVNYRVTESVFQATSYEPRYRPSYTQKSLLEAGWLGRKSGKGFYLYPEMTEALPVVVDIISEEEIFDRILTMMINDASEAVYYGISDEASVDEAMMLGANYPRGLLAWGREIGLEKIFNKMEQLYGRYKEDRYRPGQYLYQTQC